MRLLYGHTLLPKNVERHQWVNRNNRIKVIFNVADGQSTPYSAKTQRWRKRFFAMQKNLRLKYEIVYRLFRMAIQAYTLS